MSNQLVKYAVCTPDGKTWFCYYDSLHDALRDVHGLAGSVYKRVFRLTGTGHVMTENNCVCRMKWEG